MIDRGVIVYYTSHSESTNFFSASIILLSITLSHKVPLASSGFELALFYVTFIHLLHFVNALILQIDYWKIIKHYSKRAHILHNWTGILHHVYHFACLHVKFHFLVLNGFYSNVTDIGSTIPARNISTDFKHASSSDEDEDKRGLRTNFPRSLFKWNVQIDVSQLSEAL